MRAAAGHAPGHVARGQQVLTAQHGGIGAGFRRRLIDQALQHIVGFEPSDAAKGAVRRSVADDAAQYEMAGRDTVGAAQDLRQVMRHDPHAAAAEIGAVSPVAAHPHGEEPPFAVERQFALENVVASLIVAQESLASALGPFHRPLQPAPSDQGENEFRVDRSARAETAPGIGHDHMNPILFETQNGREPGPHAMRRLASYLQRETAAGRVPIGDRGARLHEIDHDPVVVQPQPADMRGGCEGRVRRAASPVAQSKVTLPGASGQICSAAGSSASSISITAGSGV